MSTRRARNEQSAFTVPVMTSGAGMSNVIKEKHKSSRRNPRLEARRSELARESKRTPPARLTTMVSGSNFDSYPAAEDLETYFKKNVTGGGGRKVRARTKGNSFVQVEVFEPGSRQEVIHPGF